MCTKVLVWLMILVRLMILVPIFCVAARRTEPVQMDFDFSADQTWVPVPLEIFMMPNCRYWAFCRRLGVNVSFYSWSERWQCVGTLDVGRPSCWRLWSRIDWTSEMDHQCMCVGNQWGVSARETDRGWLHQQAKNEGLCTLLCIALSGRGGIKQS